MDKLRQYIREMVELELNEMANIARMEKIKDFDKLEKFKKLYTGSTDSLPFKLVNAIEKGSVRVSNAEKASSNPEAQKVIDFIKVFNARPGFENHPIPMVVLTKKFNNIDQLIEDGILTKMEGVTRNGLVVATDKSHTAAISPILRQLSSSGILAIPKEEGELIVPKKEKPMSSDVKGRPTSEKTLTAKAVISKLEADINYEPSEEEINILGPEFVEKLKMRVAGTLKPGRKSLFKNVMTMFGDTDTNQDNIIDDEDLKENTNMLNESYVRMQRLAGLRKK